MKEITKVYSHIKDITTDASMSLYDYEEKDNKEWAYDTANESELKEGLEHFKLPPETEHLINAINSQMDFIVGEIVGAVHKDMMDLWKRLDALEERIGK